MINSSADKNGNITMFYAAKTPNVAVFAKKLSDNLGDNFLAIYSDHQGELPVHSTYGLISKELIQNQLSKNPNQYNYYICGPKILFINTKKILQQLGVPKNQIFVEDFSL